MTHRVLAAISAALLLAANAPAPAPGSGHVLTIDITNIRNGRGVVHVDVCRQAEFLKDCAIVNDTKSAPGTTRIVVRDLPSGVYAIQATHDENSNHKVDRGLFGIPKEGVGFSNDAPIRFGPPSWSDAMFQVTGDKTVTLKMRYFSGPSGPAR
jgi:uncharacterized protein (DUF2141 family)